MLLSCCRQSEILPHGKVKLVDEYLLEGIQIVLLVEDKHCHPTEGATEQPLPDTHQGSLETSKKSMEKCVGTGRVMPFLQEDTIKVVPKTLLE